MIDSELFAQQMGILADRIGRPLAAPTLRQFHVSLSGRLTNEEFVAATTLAFEKCRFWPSVDELVELVKPKESPEAIAEDVFQRVLDIATNVYLARMLRLEGVRFVHRSAEAAFKTVGAFGAFEGLATAELPFLRKRFIAAFVNHESKLVGEDRAQLALADADSRVQHLVASTAAARTLPGRSPKRLPPQTRGADGHE